MFHEFDYIDMPCRDNKQSLDWKVSTANTSAPSSPITMETRVVGHGRERRQSRAPSSDITPKSPTTGGILAFAYQYIRRIKFVEPPRPPVLNIDRPYEAHHDTPPLVEGRWMTAEGAIKKNTIDFLKKSKLYSITYSLNKALARIGDLKAERLRPSGAR